MVDLHTHLLPGIDDGSENMEISREMGRAYLKHGVDRVAVTPHIRQDMFPNTEERIREVFAETVQDFRTEGIDLDLRLGAEYYYDESFLSKMDDPKRLMTFDDRGRYLLVEFNPMVRPPGLRDVVFQLRMAGVRPVMAHPERYSFVLENLDWAEDLAAAGMLFQGTLGPLAGFWGKGSRKNLKRLLNAGLIHLISSDLHHPKMAGKFFGEGVRRLREWVGEARTEELLVHAPGRILQGEPL